MYLFTVTTENAPEADPEVGTETGGKKNDEEVVPDRKKADRRTEVIRVDHEAAIGIDGKYQRWGGRGCFSGTAIGVVYYDC